MRHPVGAPVTAGGHRSAGTQHTSSPPRAARLPKDRAVENAIGRFASRYSTTADGSIVVERDLRILHDVVPPEQYPMLRAIFEAMDEDARAPLVLANRAN